MYSVATILLCLSLTFHISRSPLLVIGQLINLGMHEVRKYYFKKSPILPGTEVTRYLHDTLDMGFHSCKKYGARLLRTQNVK